MAVLSSATLAADKKHSTVAGGKTQPAPLAFIRPLDKPTAEWKTKDCKCLENMTSLRVTGIAEEVSHHLYMQGQEPPGSKKPPTESWMEYGDRIAFRCTPNGKSQKCTMNIPTYSPEMMQCEFTGNVVKIETFSGTVATRCWRWTDDDGGPKWYDTTVNFNKGEMTLLAEPDMGVYTDDKGKEYQNFSVIKANTKGDVTEFAIAVDKKTKAVTHYQVWRSCGNHFGLQVKGVPPGPKGWTEVKSGWSAPKDSKSLNTAVAPLLAEFKKRS